MKRSQSFELTTEELKEAISMFISRQMSEGYSSSNVEHFSVNQSSEDVREYRTHITFKEEL